MPVTVCLVSHRAIGQRAKAVPSAGSSFGQAVQQNCKRIFTYSDKDLGFQIPF